jgi:hypothetical protein
LIHSSQRQESKSKSTNHKFIHLFKDLVDSCFMDDEFSTKYSDYQSLFYFFCKDQPRMPEDKFIRAMLTVII